MFILVGESSSHVDPSRRRPPVAPADKQPEKAVVCPLGIVYGPPLVLSCIDPLRAKLLDVAEWL